MLNEKMHKVKKGYSFFKSYLMCKISVKITALICFLTLESVLSEACFSSLPVNHKLVFPRLLRCIKT
jgi:hypothetical protein